LFICGLASTTWAALTAEENAAAVERLRTALQEQYSYRDLHGVDWEKLLKERSAVLTTAKTSEQFADETAKLLAAARDMHIWVEVNGNTFGTWCPDAPAPANVNTATLAKLVPGWTQRSKAVWSGQYPDGIGYILITTWNREPAVLEPALDALKELAGSKALIVDVRPNSGGAEGLAMKFAGCFVAKPKAYAGNVTIQKGRFGPPMTRTIKPNRKGPAYRGKVAVLMGPANMSSCESFLLMMKQVPGCVLIGGKSFGSSGNPKPVALGNGVTVYLPSWKDLRLDGSCFEGVGIAPDLEVKTTAGDLAVRDPVVAAALKVLRDETLKIEVAPVKTPTVQSREAGGVRGVKTPTVQSHEEVAETLLGQWEVEKNNGYHGTWTFTSDGQVTNSDRHHLTTHWTIESGAVMIRWNNKLWESLTLPIDPAGSTGPCWQGTAKAVKVK
jgi:hypothetical protein